MPRVRPIFSLIFSAPLTLACAHGSGGPARQPDGGYEISCKGPLSDCLNKAERACHDQGYTVAEARDTHELLGNESGQSTVMIESSEATFYCGSSKRHAARPPIELKREPSPQAAPTAAPTTAARACVPGATQTCIGPAGCSGGQACAADGSRFEACDCGGSAPAAAP
jgi:hypothetical protein